VADENGSVTSLTGVVKWFDPAKGFGFVVSDAGGPDILLHVNVLRNFGQSSVADGARVELKAQETERGVQAVSVESILPPEGARMCFCTSKCCANPVWPICNPARRWPCG